MGVNFGVIPQRGADFREVPEEIKMPIDHGHIKAVSESYAGGLAYLIAPPILQCAKDNDHSRAEDYYRSRESALSDAEFHHYDRPGAAPRLLSLKFITKSLHGENELRLLRIIFEFLAQAGDMHVHRARIHFGAVIPHLF